MQSRQNQRVYKVIVNAEKQYSIWPADGVSPLGWKEVGILGSRGHCFTFIERAWIAPLLPNSSQKVNVINRFLKICVSYF